MAERAYGLVPVDLITICRELDELAWLLDQFPPEYLTFEDGDQSVSEERVDDRIRVACRRIGKLIPSDVDAADCTFEQRGFLKALRQSIADPVSLTAHTIRGYIRFLTPRPEGNNVPAGEGPEGGKAEGRRPAKRKRKVSGKRKASNDQLFLSALSEHHLCRLDGSCGNFAPASLSELKSKTKLSKPTLSRLFKHYFPASRSIEAGYSAYKADCQTGRIASKLKSFNNPGEAAVEIEKLSEQVTTYEASLKF